jgi:hypothetical protein
VNHVLFNCTPLYIDLSVAFGVARKSETWQAAAADCCLIESYNLIYTPTKCKAKGTHNRDDYARD